MAADEESIDTPGIAHTHPQALLRCQRDARSVVSADRFPSSPVTRHLLREDARAGMDIGTWVEQLLLRDSQITQYPGVGIDLHDADVDRPRLAKVRPIHGAGIEGRFGLGNCDQERCRNRVLLGSLLPAGAGKTRQERNCYGNNGEVRIHGKREAYPEIDNQSPRGAEGATGVFG